MKASELIEELEKAIKINGDLEVVASDYFGAEQIVGITTEEYSYKDDSRELSFIFLTESK